MATGALTEQVAEELEQAAVVTRQIDKKTLASFWIGVGIGVGVGFYIGYRYSKKKLRKEILEEAEKEIAEIRDHYQQKVRAAEAQTKPPVEDLIRERGYDSPVDVRPTRPPVPVDPPKPMIRNITTPTDSTEVRTKNKDEGWDWDLENSRRRPDQPYIIHQDEFISNENGYTQVWYIYYEGDDVLVDDSHPETIINNRENLIGETALDYFGHGSDDRDLVHVRNSELQLEVLIKRTSESWEEEVLGLGPEPDDSD